MAITPKKPVNKSLINLTLLTKWLLGNNVNISSILNDPASSSYKFRLISYLLKYPRLIVYVNNYLNDIYLFDNAKYTLENWLETFKFIIKHNNFKSVDRIYFTKFKIAKRISFKNEIKEYELNFNDRILSEDDLNELYRLYSIKIISDELFEEIKLINLGKDNKTAKLPILSQPQIEISSKPQLNESILNFNNTLTNYIKSRVLCKNCALYPNEKYPIISNIKDETENLDVIIVGEYPSRENFLEDYKAINALMNKFKLKYVATNLVLCKPTGQEIPNATKTISNCKEVTNHIYKYFKSNFKILIGPTVKRAFGINIPITKIVDNVVNDCFILPGSEKVSAYKYSLILLNEYLEKYTKEKINRINIEQSAIETKSINFNVDLKNYTLFDIKVINEKLLYILLENETGNKKYITEDISYPIYIKKGNFRQCEFLIDDCDYVVYLTNQQKMNLTQTLRKQLSQEVLI